MRGLIRNLIANGASALIEPTGFLDSRISASSGRGQTWTIVMYHRVIDDAQQDPFGLGMCVQRDRFRRQLLYLKQAFTIIPIGEALARTQRGDPLPPRALSVSFDDGYLDNLEVAMPVLEEFGVAATLFVATGAIETGVPFWWDRVIAAVCNSDAEAIDPVSVGLTGSGPLALSRGVRARTVERLLAMLWRFPVDEILHKVARIEHALQGSGPNRMAPAPVLRPQQLQELHRRGMSIGAHSVRHPDLTLCSPGALSEEVQASRRYLEALCQAQVEGFAYPGGHVSPEVRQAVADAGYRFALATTTGINRAPFEPLMLRRVGMPDTRLADFKRALGTALMDADQPSAETR
ncbi:MAG TPA: polysaccharide deacetylase family protein [Burkholderiaceae bacterium]|nr:polysaccharide deacetylase family protein [Burkholderiaceae bacterium]